MLLIIALIFIAGCAANDTSQKADYDATKKMIVDILKTDDGKKAIREIMSDEELKQELVLEQPVVTETIENTLVSEKGRQFWKKSFSDPKFAKNFAESMNDEHEKLLKSLMNDPEYRDKVSELLTDTTVEENILNILKSTKYREHLQQVIKETFENPIFQAKIQDILIKGAEDLNKGDGDKKDDDDENDNENDKENDKEKDDSDKNKENGIDERQG